MPTLAVAGGTSYTLGRAIISALLKGGHTPTWDAVILSRSTTRPLWLCAIDPEGKRTRVHVVDYMDVPSIRNSLKDVDTVVSVTSAIDGTQGQIQLNLLQASIQAGCKRFAPAQWGMGLKSYDIGITKMSNDGVWEECEKAQDEIEIARFNNGSFMNYFALGVFPSQPEKSEEETLRALAEGDGYMAGADAATQGIAPQGDMPDGSGAFLLSLSSAIAELPVKEDGQYPRISTTTLRDIGRFVAASLNLPKWETDMSIVGDTVTMGELLAAAESVVGKPFEVTKVSPKTLQQKMSTLEEHQFMEALWIEFKLSYTKDEEGLGVMTPIANRLLHM